MAEVFIDLSIAIIVQAIAGVFTTDRVGVGVIAYESRSALADGDHTSADATAYAGIIGSGHHVFVYRTVAIIVETITRFCTWLGCTGLLAAIDCQVIGIGKTNFTCSDYTDTVLTDRLSIASSARIVADPAMSFVTGQVNAFIGGPIAVIIRTVTDFDIGVFVIGTHCR